MKKKPPECLKDGIGTKLDDCSWDYKAPKLQRRFFLNPMSAFFGDFPWDGRNPKGAQTTTSEDSLPWESPSHSDPLE